MYILSSILHLKRIIFMLCKIADLIVEIPDDSDMEVLCREYLYNDVCDPDIKVLYEKYPFNKYPDKPKKSVIYMFSGIQFYKQLLDYDGMELHSSAVEYKGKVYLFSGPSGMGKSTHTKLWTRVFEGARVINDDKPALRLIDGVWYAYGTPWSGKSFLNINTKAPVGGLCFLERGETNSIRKLPAKEAVINVIAQTFHRNMAADRMEKMFNMVEALISDIPVFELHCLADEEAARMSCETMMAAAKEKDL